MPRLADWWAFILDQLNKISRFGARPRAFGLCLHELLIGHPINLMQASLKVNLLFFKYFWFVIVAGSPIQKIYKFKNKIAQQYWPGKGHGLLSPGITSRLTTKLSPKL